MTEQVADLTAKRNFYLMLSPTDGQDIAVGAGLVPSTDEVYDEEQKDVLRSWGILTSSGVVESLSVAADWMADIMVNDNMIPDEDDMEDDDMVQLGFDIDPSSEEDFLNVHAMSFEDLKKMHQQIKDSTYNTVLGCMVSSISKLLDEDLVVLTP
jgi:hypothetical protein